MRRKVTGQKGVALDPLWYFTVKSGDWFALSLLFRGQDRRARNSGGVDAEEEERGSWERNTAVEPSSSFREYEIEDGDPKFCDPYVFTDYDGGNGSQGC